MIVPILMLCMGHAGIVKAQDSDLSTISNVIYVKPTTANLGEQTTLSICMENAVPIVVFDFFDSGALERVIAGENTGTLVADVADELV